MYIYSFDGFDGKKESSRALLARAIDMFSVDAELAVRVPGEELVEKIVTGEHGKPSIPDWYEFSVSHTGDVWAVLFAGSPCGLDIQYAKECDASRIAERFFAEEERAKIAEDPENFWPIWTRREAAVKAIGSTVTRSIPSVLGEEIELEGKGYSLFDIELLGEHEGMYAAACIEGFPDTVNYYRL